MREGLVFHENGIMVDANPAALDIFGISEIDEIIGKSLLDFVVPEYHEQVMEKLRQETVLPYEIEGKRKDGSVFPIETSTHVYKLGNRTLRATTISDITQRKSTQELLLREIEHR